VTPARISLIALAVAALATDLVRTGSDELAHRAEIARAEDEIVVLRRHHADLRIATQRRILARIGASGLTPGEELARLELRREATPWERDRPERQNRAYASETGWPTRIGLEEWLRAREGTIDAGRD
jgi:hypothetical protein